MEGEGGGSGVLQGHLGGAYRGFRAGAVELDTGRCARRHFPDPGVVGVEDGHTALTSMLPAGRECLDEFALGLGDGVAVTELTHVGGTDVEHHPDPWRSDPAQVGDVFDTA